MVRQIDPIEPRCGTASPLTPSDRGGRAFSDIANASQNRLSCVCRMGGDTGCSGKPVYTQHRLVDKRLPGGKSFGI
jgi:hypothetical protein